MLILIWRTLKNFKAYFVRTFTILNTNKDYCDLIPTIVLDMFVDPCQNARKPRLLQDFEAINNASSLLLRLPFLPIFLCPNKLQGAPLQNVGFQMFNLIFCKRFSFANPIIGGTSARNLISGTQNQSKNGLKAS